MNKENELQIGIDLSDLKRTWEEIEEKYKKRNPRWKCIFNSDDLMIDISNDKQALRISWFKNWHYVDEKVVSLVREEENE